jgi:stress response protein SCP2
MGERRTRARPLCTFMDRTFENRGHPCKERPDLSTSTSVCRAQVRRTGFPGISNGSLSPPALAPTHQATFGFCSSDGLDSHLWKGVAERMDLTAGQNVAVTTTRAVNVRVRRTGQTQVDLIALVLDDRGQVGADADFVFYNAPHHPSGGVTLAGEGLSLDLRLVPAVVERIIVAANSDGQLDGLTVLLESDEELSFAPVSLAGLPTAVLLEVYRRGGGWRVRAVGQGWAAGLAGLAREYGVNVDDQPDEPAARGSLERDLAPVQSELERLVRRREILIGEVAALDRQVREAREAIVETDELRLLQQVGYYQFRHPLDDVLSSKQRLDRLRGAIKEAITKRTAVRGTPGWMVNGSLKEGAALVRQFSDLMLRTYNIEADNCVRTVRAHTVNTAKKRLERTREAIVKNGSTMGVAIDENYHALRLEELQLTADHHLRVEQEKEDAREERQRLREEAKAQEEFKRRKKDLLKEQAHYQSLLERSRLNGDQAGLLEARERLAEITESIEDVEEMAANTRVGYVYVISNLGAFGDRVVKIGMTRREDPMQRVYELGSASVPFKFDVHTLVFSHDAVALETALHREFDQQRVNRVNRRREFFRVSLAEVRAALEKVGTNHVVEFREVAEAPEWRQSQAQQAGNAHSGVDLSR